MDIYTSSFLKNYFVLHIGKYRIEYLPKHTYVRSETELHAVSAQIYFKEIDLFFVVHQQNCHESMDTNFQLSSFR